jgi:hypothetical protein
MQIAIIKASEILNTLNTSDADTNEKSVFTKRTVGELLFDGFHLKTLKEIEEMQNTFYPNFKIKYDPFRISDKVSHMHIVCVDLNQIKRFHEIYFVTYFVSDSIGTKYIRRALGYRSRYC